MWVYDDDLYRNQYYLGSQLLVCPILEPKDPVMNRSIHRFFVPEGTWYDFVTGKKFPGNKKYVSFFKEEDYPVFAKQGSIIPLSNKSNINNTSNPTDLEIQIFPGKSNTFELYEDDGISSLYKEKFYLITSIDYNYMPNNYTVIIRSIEGKSGIAPDLRNYKIRFRNTRMSEKVSALLNNEEIKCEVSLDDNDLIILIKDVNTAKTLSISCIGKDIEIDAVRIINEDINSIISDLKIDTSLKEKIAEIVFDTELPMNKKRIYVRKLKSYGLDQIFIKMFIKLLEYIEEI
jgi:hypothetical protein